VRLQAIRESAVLFRQLPGLCPPATIVSEPLDASADPSLDRFIVVVHHNLVVAVRRYTGTPSDVLTKLEIGTRLAQSFQQRGCIDGTYAFASAQSAKVFASLCTEFTQAILAKRLEAIHRLPLGVDYEAA
jgi:hypothetical protein